MKKYLLCSLLLSLSYLSLSAQFVPFPAPALLEYSHDSVAFTAQTEKKVAFIKKRPTDTLTYCRINQAALNKDTLMVELPNQRRCFFVKKEDQSDPFNFRTWQGQALQQMGYAHFTVKNGKLTGSLSWGNQQYSIYPIDGQRHVIMRIKQDPDKKDETQDDYDKLIEKANKKLLTPKNDGANAAPPPSECRLRVLIAMTDDVWDGLEDPQAFARACIQNANMIYGNSEVAVRAELARVMRVVYVETDSARLDLISFHGNGDGQMDEVHSAKDYYDADIAVLITSTGGRACGVAYDIGATESEEAYCVVVQSCAMDNFSFVHEMGHLFGARHDHYVDSENHPYAFGHGYVNPNPGARWRTVMAYNDRCLDVGLSCPRIPYFSNPGITYNGNATGVTNIADNSLAHDAGGSITMAFETTLNTKTMPVETIRGDNMAYVLANRNITNQGNYIIQSSAEVVWSAGNYIDLSPGFWAMPGSTFSTGYITCTGGFDEPADLAAPQDKKAALDVAPAPLASIEVFPNPFADQTSIQFTLPGAVEVHLAIFSFTGQQVATLLDGVMLDSGVHQVDFQAGALPPGVYLCRLQVGPEEVKTIKMVLLE